MSASDGQGSIYGTMSDAQLRETISQLSRHQAYPNQTYQQNLQSWSSNPQATPKGAIPSQRTSTRSRTLRAAPSTPAPAYGSQQQAAPAPSYVPASTNPPPPPLPTMRQASTTTYPSRMRTGATLLMQPILVPSVAQAAAAAGSSSRTSRRTAAVVSYQDPGSGDDFPDAGEREVDSDDSDFQASGGTRTAVRKMGYGPGGRTSTGISVFHSGSGTPVSRTPQPQPAIQSKSGIDQSYLGMIPPARLIVSKPVAMTSHDYFAQDIIEYQAQRPAAPVPVRVEFETDTHRIRDCFVWNLNESLITPDKFAQIFCVDLDLPAHQYAETIANQIRAQLEDHEGVASMDFGIVSRMDQDSREDQGRGEITPECRVILEIDVQIGNHHLHDHIEWDLLSPLTPEAFAQRLSMDLGLAGEAVPLIAHAVHEELIKHKKDAVEWGVIGGEPVPADDRERDRSGLGLVKDKTGLGLSWGRAPKDGRGPKGLKSVWRDWQEAEEFGTRFDLLTAEDIERKETERERASRRLRRETSKFQATGRRRR